jgi:hypothetical protein
MGFSDYLLMMITGKGPSVKDSSKKDDWKIREELSDLIGADCQYDKIPSAYPISESGFDVSNQFVISRKSFDVIDIIAEEESIFKLRLTIPNPKNTVNAFIYRTKDMNNLLSIAETQLNGDKLMIIGLPKQKKAYKLKLSYDSLDEQDSCPIY